MSAAGKEAWMHKKYHVTLNDEERKALGTMIASGRGAARKLMHARILLKADGRHPGSGWADRRIAAALEVGMATVERVRERFVEEGLEAALVPRKPRREYPRKLGGEEEAHLIALTCGTPPEGHALRLLADRMVALEYVDTVSHETVRRVLKKMNSSRG
jgi:transposase